MPANEESFRVPEHAGHVTNQFGRSANAFAGAKIAKSSRSIAQSLLRAVRQGGQKMSQQCAFVIHDGQERLACIPPLSQTDLLRVDLFVSAKRTNENSPAL